MVVRRLLLRRMHFFLRARQKINTVKCSFKAILQCFSEFFQKICILGPLGIFRSVIFIPRLLFSLSAVGECAE
jgi:hypothetical protein